MYSGVHSICFSPGHFVKKKIEECASSLLSHVLDMPAGSGGDGMKWGRRCDRFHFVLIPLPDLRKDGPPSKIQMLKKIRKIRRAALKAESLERQQNLAKGGRAARYQCLLGFAALGLLVVFLVHHSCDTWIESLTVTVIAFVIGFGCVL